MTKCLIPFRDQKGNDLFFSRAVSGGSEGRRGVVVPPIQAALESHLGWPVALSTVYRMLHRQGWRKLAPDKRHPNADPAAQEEWKKTPRDPC
jgi:hypothetical protein